MALHKLVHYLVVVFVDIVFIAVLLLMTVKIFITGNVNDLFFDFIRIVVMLCQSPRGTI